MWLAGLQAWHSVMQQHNTSYRGYSCGGWIGRTRFHSTGDGQSNSCVLVRGAHSDAAGQQHKLHAEAMVCICIAASLHLHHASIASCSFSGVVLQQGQQLGQASLVA